MKIRWGGLPTRSTYLPPETGTQPTPSDDDDDREPILDRTPFGMPWHTPTWLVVFWTALIAILGFAAFTEPANSASLTFGLLVLVVIWSVGMVPLGLLWVAAWFRRRRNGVPD